MPNKPWYQAFFGQRYLDSYRLLKDTEGTLRETEFIEKALALPPGAKILNLCCGHGRHVVELAARGYAVTGLDLDTLFLDLARKEAGKSGLAVTLVHQDMRDIPFSGELDCTINFFTAFGYLENEDEDQKVLNGVARALKPGGRFLVDLAGRDNVMRRYQTRDWFQTPSGVTVLDERQFEPITERNNRSYRVRQVTIYPDGRRVEVEYSLRLYTFGELARMLSRAGLAVEAAYGGIDESAFTLESRRLIMVARKNP